MSLGGDEEKEKEKERGGRKALERVGGRAGDLEVCQENCFGEQVANHYLTFLPQCFITGAPLSLHQLDGVTGGGP